MPAPPRKNDPRPEDRRQQVAHGAQSDQGGRAYRPQSSREKPEPQAYEGPEESNQQRRS
ncbi:MAG TPA: hypothetical protein VM582_04670 [Candidatus Thermoplasmatota archaeon]|nr:hypothetical protein [Candidatus Thermoplasmatota archaeon]